jgi:sugar phosphate isomerase/epimerase
VFQATSISCCFDYTVPIDRQLDLIAAAGFTHVSPSRAEHAGYLDPQRRRALAKRLASAGLGVDTIHGPTLTAPDAVEVAAATIGAAAEIGASTVVLHPTPFMIEPGATEDLLDVTRRRLAQVVGTVHGRGVTVALENLCPGPAIEVLTSLLDDVDPAIAGFCYDSSHDQIDGPNPLDLLERLGERVKAVHLSDRKAPFVDHLIPGEGFIDFDAICERLALTPFSGPVLLEVMNTHTAEKRPRELVLDAHRAAAALSAKVTAARRR